MKIAHFDCPAGASGNMILGALIDAGLDVAWLESELRKLALPAWQLVRQRVVRQGISALHVDFDVQAASEAPRGLTQIQSLIASAGLSPRVRAHALAMFARLGGVEAAVHGVPVEQVHFHEIGAVDAILDVVGAALAFDALEFEKVNVSRINVGGGVVRAAHGVLPVPAPATVRLLEGSAATLYSSTDVGELLTPTGALVLTEFATSYGPAPALQLRRHGYGAGARDLDFPNVLRVLVGAAAEGPTTDTAVVFETNIDDMNPQIYPHVTERLFAVGALDVTTTALGMKKGRPGVLLSAIAPPERVEAVIDVLLAETTTLGVRMYDVRRAKLERRSYTVDTPYGAIGVKASYVGRRRRDVAPEAEDCRRAALAHRTPFRSVYDAARAAGLLNVPETVPPPADEGATS
ncbi:MAG: nickel pincer cofactor biosynthesis protein LarC [Actinobacteria bacterium]|nr:nickel pincer cofactor biosynthesis protein LarC [Actinomycetota bacterium]